MRKLCHLLLLFWGFWGRDHFAHAQLVKAYQYDFESPIISISAKRLLNLCSARKRDI